MWEYSDEQTPRVKPGGFVWLGEAPVCAAECTAHCRGASSGQLPQAPKFFVKPLRSKDWYAVSANESYSQVHEQAEERDQSDVLRQQPRSKDDIFDAFPHQETLPSQPHLLLSTSIRFGIQKD
jgi:hypothetical protein